MNAPVFEEAEDIDYLITNFEGEIVTEQWIVDTYSQRNWVEVFYREALMMVGVKRISSSGKKELRKTFYLGILCLYFYSLAEVNWRFKTALGK